MVNHIYKFTSGCHSQITPSSDWRESGPGTFLAPSADKKTRNYDIEFSKHHPSLSTLKPNGLSRSKMKWSDIHINFPVDVIVRLPHLWNGNRQGQEIFLASSAYKKSRHCDIEWSKRHPSLSTIRPKGLSRSQMKWWALYTNLPEDVIIRLPHLRIRENQGQETFLAPPAYKQTRNYDIECSNLPSLTINPKTKGIEVQQDEMVSHMYKFTSGCHSRTTPFLEGR